MQPIQQQATIADIETSREAHTRFQRPPPIEPKRKLSCRRDQARLDHLSKKRKPPQTWLKGKWQSRHLPPACPSLLLGRVDGLANKSRNAHRYAVFIGLVVIAALCVASWFLAPKGENQVSVLVSVVMRSPSPYDMTYGFANAELLQALAVIADSRHRELLPDVGHHLHGPAAPPDCAETKRHSRRVPR